MILTTCPVWAKSAATAFSRSSARVNRRRHGRREVEDWTEFCDLIGVEVERQFWEGSLTSGQFSVGWIDVGTEAQVQEAGRSLLAELRDTLNNDIRQPILAELAALDDLDEFLDRTKPGRWQLERELEQARREAAQLRQSLSKLEKQQQDLIERHASRDSRQLDAVTLALAVHIVARDPRPRVAGPLAWTGTKLFAIVTLGKSELPAGSLPALLLAQLVERGVPVQRVRELTPVNYHLNPFHRSSPGYPGAWADLWREPFTQTCRLTDETNRPLPEAEQLLQEVGSWAD